MKNLSLFLLLSILLSHSVFPVSDELPPRPVPHNPTPIPENASSSVSSTGANIVLQGVPSQLATTDYWTVVQWQDNNGNWFDVVGWQGNFDSNQEVMWWVDEKDFDTGPFRWVVYENENENGNLLIATDEFNLPAKNAEVIYLRVDLP